MEVEEKKKTVRPLYCWGNNCYLLIQPGCSLKPTKHLRLQSFKVKWAVCFPRKPSWKKASCGNVSTTNSMQFGNKVYSGGFKEVC